MKKELLKRFEELNELVDAELTDIVSNLVYEYNTYEELLIAIGDYYESELGLDDLLCEKIQLIMVAQATGK